MNELLDQVYREMQRLSENGEHAGYEEFVQVVELREQLVVYIEANRDFLTPEEKKMLNHLGTMDSKILNHMNRLKIEAKDGLLKMQHSKIQKSGYSSYTVNESFMFDERK